MENRVSKRDAIQREKAIYRYVHALDQGDMSTIAAILEAAMDDPELDRVIAEVHLAVLEEELLSQITADAQVVRDLLRTHLSSAFEEHSLDEKPLTVGEVAARLQADDRVPTDDQEINQLLLGNSAPLPKLLSMQTVRQLAADLGIVASERFWRTFRDTAITLGMGRSHSQAQLAAAREERARRTRRAKSSQSPPHSRTDTSEGRNGTDEHG